MPVDLLTFGTIGQLIRAGNTLAKSQLLLQEAIGVAGILTLSKVGANSFIGKRQNDVVIQLQKVEDFLGGTKASEKFSDFIGNKLNLDKDQTDDIKDFFRFDKHQMDRGDVEIYELGFLHAFLAYQKSGGNGLIATGALVTTVILMKNRRRQMEQAGQDFNFAKCFSRAFGYNIPVLSSITKWLQPVDDYFGEDARKGFGNKGFDKGHEEFVNDILDGKGNDDLKTFDKGNKLDVKNPIKDIDTDSLLPDDDFTFDQDGLDKRAQKEQLKKDIESVKTIVDIDGIIRTDIKGSATYDPDQINNNIKSDDETPPVTPPPTPTPAPTNKPILDKVEEYTENNWLFTNVNSAIHGYNYLFGDKNKNE